MSYVNEQTRRLASAIDGETYFVTSGTDRRERYFIYAKYAELFIDTLYRYRSQGKYNVHSFIDENPVKAGLVKAPEGYPYGSASGKYDLDPPPARLLTAAAKAGGL